MATSFELNTIHWKLISNEVHLDTMIREYEASILNSQCKYHLSVVVLPEGESRTYSVI